MNRMIKIGVIDESVSLTLPKFRKSLYRCKAFGKVSKRHGTFIVSTILDSFPEAFLCIAHGEISNKDNFIEMLKWMQEQDVNILNLSLAYEFEIPEIKEILGRIREKGCWIFASWNPKLAFPWSYDSCISVGNGGQIKRYPNKHYTMGNCGVFTEMSGSSIATALASGVAGSCLLHNPNTTIEEFIEKPFDFIDVTRKKQTKSLIIEL